MGTAGRQVAERPSPAEYRLRESRFLVGSVAAMTLGTALLRLVAVRLLGLGPFVSGAVAWAAAFALFGFYVARRREAGSAGDGMLLALAVGTVGALAGLLLALF